MQTFYSHGKLLLSAEYAVLDGALALALPTKFGQSLTVKSTPKNTILWKSISCEGSIWFEAEFILDTALKISSENTSAIAVRLVQILNALQQLNPSLFEAQKGYEMVFARRKIRQDNFLKKLSSRLFYSLFSYLTDTKQDPAIANFGIYSQKSIQAILSMNDSVRYFPTMMQWVGFNKTTLDVLHGSREEGSSSYTFKKLVELAVNNIIAFSDKPLKLTIKFGLYTSLIAALIGAFYLFAYISGNIVVAGFTSLIIAISFFSGLIIFFLGMLGIYIGKIFDRVKGRPTFIVDEMIKQSSQNNLV